MRYLFIEWKMISKQSSDFMFGWPIIILNFSRGSIGIQAVITISPHLLPLNICQKARCQFVSFFN
ncbi:MAG: hypothetical protein CO125_04090 [Hydrogenophilales bacterium CG_4_9_14_3_um_filter_59_35]|nr:MAG: hypothetical protein COZ23_02490 [Hydrogenophilales bacterium CG_4_10_14_3_um_filter_58_23]PJB07699.1 MAG: hypothetical protein CO125_04090 [Hydrogenophilales bacterium CG_4_9_14_3_um_filter_59_35]